ncbi:hypothetical protein NGA_0711400, partial [Nannochloropsis gaditana CCMP526]
SPSLGSTRSFLKGAASSTAEGERTLRAFTSKC